MNFLRSSTSPVSFQGTLEVSPFSSDRCVTHQPGSYSPRPGGSHAGGSRAGDGTPAAAGQRTQDALRAGAGGTVGVPPVPRGAQLPPADGGAASRHPSERGERPQHLPQNQRVDATAARTAGRERDRETPEPSDARLGELVLPRPGQSGLPSGRRARDEAAAPVAVPEAQGTHREVRALPGRAPTERHGTHAPESADASLAWAKG